MDYDPDVQNSDDQPMPATAVLVAALCIIMASILGTVLLIVGANVVAGLY